MDEQEIFWNFDMPDNRYVSLRKNEKKAVLRSAAEYFLLYLKAGDPFSDDDIHRAIDEMEGVISEMKNTLRPFTG